MPAVTREILKHFEAREWPMGLPVQTDLQDSIHDPDLAERDRYILALFDSSDNKLVNQARRMASCADSVHLFIDAELGAVHEYIHRCKCRLCPLCARSRAIRVGAQVEDLVRAMKAPKHLVLTVKSNTVALREQLQDLRQWFAKLRRTPFWKANVTQGVYTVEVTINEKTGLWHPHIHCVFEGRYLPFKIVQRLWHEVTGGSQIIWIEKVDNVPGMAKELCKYIGKPQDAAHWTDEQLRTYAKAIQGIRMMQSFGKRKPKAIEDNLPDPVKSSADWSISLNRVLWLASMNQSSAYKALVLIAELYPHLGRFIYSRMPQLEPEQTKMERQLSIIEILRTGKAPPRHAQGPKRPETEIMTDLIPQLSILHELSEAEIWQ